MPITEKLFYSGPHLFEAEARILAVEGTPGSPLLVLDRSIFYPEGGGQACDLGTIDGVKVLGVTEEVSPAEGPRILHALQGPLPGALEPGRSVRLRVDAARRLDYSQQHSAQHLISATCFRLLGAPTVSVHLGREACLIDFDIAAIPDEDLAEVEALVEAAIAGDVPIRVHSCPPEDLSSFTLRKRPPAGEEVLRIVEIEGIDMTPCCGTHVASAGKLRLVSILGTERYKGMTRLSFLAGGRAVSGGRAMYQAAREASRVLGTSIAELPAAVAREAESRLSLERANLGLIRERAAGEAATALAAAGGAGLVVMSFPDRGADSLMESAKALTALGATALVASVSELTVQALAPSPGLKLGERLKPLLAGLGGKGGGGPASFRAVLPDAQGLERFMAEARALLG